MENTDNIEVSSPSHKSKDTVREEIQSDFQNLRQICSDTQTSISNLAGQPFEGLSTAAVSRKQQVTKTILFEWIKKLLRQCNRMCAKDIYTPTHDVKPPASVSDDVHSTSSSDDIKQYHINSQIKGTTWG